MPEWNCLWSTSNSLVFIGIFQSEQKHQNKDQVSSNSLFKVEQMKGPNIKKKKHQRDVYYWEEIRNYLVSLPNTKCPMEAKKKLKYENQLIIDFGGQKKNKYNRISILVL